MRKQSDSIVAHNVASVKLLSPFRYPGGKTWLIPRIKQWLSHLRTRPVKFIEPFAGGAVVGLTVAAELLAGNITLVELDDQVAAVWQTILRGDAKGLVDRITAFHLTLDTAKRELETTPRNLTEKAFQAVLKNRVNHSGIMAPGAGMLCYGENGKGIKSRWYPEVLKKRILEIARMKDRITFIKADGIEVLKKNANRTNFVFFIDPPYTAGGKEAGRRLYTHHQLDHEELFRVTNTLSGDFLMTYSNDEIVHELAQRYNFDIQEITMKSNHHVRMTELLIGRDLDWVR